MDEKNPDPIKDPEFQKVIRHFVTTAPKSHDEIRGKKKPKAKSGEMAIQRGKKRDL
jgi:hypothetical protein